VSEIVKEMVAAGAHAICASNSHFGDPQPGVKKTLSIITVSSIEGRVYHEQCEEEEFIFVSPCARLLKADYSSWRKGKDVTEVVKEKMRQGLSMLWATDFEFAFGDPDKDYTKTLTVHFEDGSGRSCVGNCISLLPVNTLSLSLRGGKKKEKKMAREDRKRARECCYIVCLSLFVVSSASP